MINPIYLYIPISMVANKDWMGLALSNNTNQTKQNKHSTNQKWPFTPNQTQLKHYVNGRLSETNK